MNYFRSEHKCKYKTYEHYKEENKCNHGHIGFICFDFFYVLHVKLPHR